MDNELNALVAAYEAIAGLDDPARARVMRWLSEKFDTDSKPSEPTNGARVRSTQLRASSPQTGGPTANASTEQPVDVTAEESHTEHGDTISDAIDDVLSPRDFLAQKKPRSDVQKVAALGYYLTKYRNTPHFDTRAVAALAEEAGLPPFRSAPSAVSNAQSQLGYLVSAGERGARKLSEVGTDLVESLPKPNARTRRSTKSPTVAQGSRKRSAGSRNTQGANSKNNVSAVEFSTGSAD